MQKYANTNGDSGVDSFEMGDSYITVQFKGTPRTYTYSHNIAGQHHVDKMKELAVSGNGLNAYINYNVKFKYDR